MTSRIDVHHHAVVPAWAEQVASFAPGRPVRPWTPAAAIEAMDRHRVAHAVLSLTAPGVYFGDAARARKVAREANEQLAECVDAGRPSASGDRGRFSFFASLPLPDVEGALAEIEHASSLGCAGFTLLTNVDGRYPGDPGFAPVWEELDRRGAVVFLHPNWTDLALVPGVSGAIADFLLDTVRAAVSLLFAGVPRRHRHVKIVLSHAGGFLPYNVHRVAGMASTMLEPVRDAGELLEDARGFWFDTALSSSPTALPSLLAFADPARIVYGTDWPYAPSPTVEYFERHFDAYEFEDGQRGAIESGNARRLLGWE